MTESRLPRTPIERTVGEVLINRKTPMELFNQTGVSGYERLSREVENKFSNPYTQASEYVYMKIGGRWSEIFRDIVECREKELGEIPPEVDAIPVLYRAWAETPREVAKKTWALKSGFYVPVADDQNGYKFFDPDTLMPKKVVPFDKMTEAERAFSIFDLPLDYISGFWRPDNYIIPRIVGRDFDPSTRAFGRICIDAGIRPDVSFALPWAGSVPIDGSTKYR